MVFSDAEMRILLAALSRERKVCEKCDREFPEGLNLTRICVQLERKIMNMQYRRICNGIDKTEDD